MELTTKWMLVGFTIWLMMAITAMAIESKYKNEQKADNKGGEQSNK